MLGGRYRVLPSGATARRVRNVGRSKGPARFFCPFTVARRGMPKTQTLQPHTVFVFVLTRSDYSKTPVYGFPSQGLEACKELICASQEA